MDQNNHVLVIAEAGVNHNGDLNLAKKMIDVASDSGADFVKFQTFQAELLVTKNAEKAEYQKNSFSDDSQYQMLKKLELRREDHFELIKHSQDRKISFLSTAFDLNSLEFLVDLNLNLVKIPSGEITNLPYLRRVGILNKMTVMSTGMADLNEVGDAVNVLLSSGLDASNLILLHCTTQYPTPMIAVNLNAMRRIGEEFGVRFGYSDHTQGIEVSIAAVSMGACLIEKHFTLSKSMVGPDHFASLEPNELKHMIQSIRNIELAMGSGQKIPTEVERKISLHVRKSLVAILPISEGEIFNNRNIGIKRPGTGISPMRLNEVLGMVARRNYEIDELIEI
jgi:N,N'-diacetyllegionaminate synthase